MNYALGAIIATVVYGIVIMCIGIVAYRKSVASPSDYFIANRGFGTLVLLMTSAATFASMYSFLGAYGLTWRVGVNFLNQGWWMLMFISWSLYAFGSRIWLLGRRFGFITPADLMADYYGSNTVRILVALIGMIGVFPYAAIQFSGIGKTFEGFTNGAVSYTTAVIIVLAFTAVYTLIGGMRAVAWTDVIQGIFFTIIMFIVPVWAFAKLGGIGSAFRQVAEINPKLLTFDDNAWPGFLQLGLIWGIGFFALPHMWQRWYAAKDIVTIYRSSWLLGVFNWAICIPIMMVGLLAHVLMPELTIETSDHLVPMLLAKYLPFLGMFVVAGAFAAGMSTIDSMLLTVSSIFEEDIYAKFINPEATEKQRAKVSRIFVAIFSGLLLLFALSEAGQGFIIPIGSVGPMVAMMVLPALIGPLYWPRATKPGAIASLTVGTVFILSTLLPSVKAIMPDSGYLSYPVYPGLFLTTVTFIVVSKLTKPVPYSKQAEYHGYLSSVIYSNSLQSETAYEI